MSLELPFGLKVINPLPADDKYLSNGVPYSSISQVNIEIPITIRHIGLTVNINGVEYWYKDGVNNIDLVIKQSIGALNITGYTAATEIRLQNIESNIFELQVFSANTINTINDIQSDITYISGITSGKQDALTAGRGISSSALSNDIVQLDLNGYTAQGNIHLNITGSSEFKIFDNSTVKTGVEYGADYSPFYTNRSLVDKEYVDDLVGSLSAGLSPKNSVNIATAGNNISNLSSYPTAILDGIPLQNGWRVLIKDQTNLEENGIYTWNSGPQSFSRVSDFDDPTEMISGSFVTVITGNTLATTAWIMTSPSVVTVGVDPVEWSVFSIPTAGITSIQNIGIGEEIHSGTTSGIAYLKSLLADGDADISSDDNEITINVDYKGSSSTSTVNLGGIFAGYVLSGKTLSTILQDLLSPALNPTIVAPSNTFVMSPFTNGQNLEVGSIVNITFTAGFSRGSISPAYCSGSPFRSGLPNTYNYTGTGLVTTGSLLLTNVQTVSSYTVLVGTNTWLSSVSYNSGATAAFNSACGVFSPALVAGNTGSIARTLNGIYPYFYGKVASGGAPAGINRPAATLSLVTGGTKVVLPSTGTIAITFAATSDDYLWFAIPQTSTSKTKWYVDALNNGTIGGAVTPAGNLFPAESIVSVTTVLWAGVNYKVYISNYQTATIGSMEMRNS